MNPFTKRNLLIPFSAILFTGLLYGHIKLIPLIESQVQHLQLIAISFIIMVSLAVMLFWSLLGVFGGLISFLAAMIFLHEPLTDLNPYYYNVLILAFFLNSFLGYNINRKINASNREYTVTAEKVQEDTNLIRDHMKNREAEVSAMSKKVSGLLKLKNIADSLSLALSDEEIIRNVAEKTFNIFREGSRVSLFVVDESTKALDLSYTAKDENRRPVAMEEGGIFDRWVMKNMKSLLVKDARKDFRFSMDEEEMKDDFISIISKPLIIEGNVLGILRVDSPYGSAYSQYELRILDIIGELAAVALENARLYRRTKELAIRDSLTGLYVHRYFMERFEEEVNRAQRSDSSFGLLMLDIDNFKDFNDKHGHIAGDVILKNISGILASKASAGDIIGRYGGEEFVFLVLNCGKKDAIDLAENIRDQIQNSSVVLRRKEYSVTVSVGVAVFPEDARFREDIIWEADRCLYAAKSKGKNIVCSK